MLRRIPAHLWASLVVFLSAGALTSPLSAQSTLTGFVIDRDSVSVGFVNVQVVAYADSAFIEGVVGREDGTFVIGGIEAGEYRLFVSLIGYRDYISEKLSLSGSGTLDVGSIRLEEEVLQMEAISVEARRALYQQRGDRLVINVGNSITLSGKTALQVLQRSPGVLVNEQSGSISMLGKDGVEIMINGKRSYLPAAAIVQYLAGVSADNIETIELITAPPANMDAEGNAGFINIVMRESIDTGLTGSVTVSGGYGDGEVASASATVDYQRGSLRLNSSYSALRNGQNQFFSNYRRVVSSNGVVETPTTTSRDPLQMNHDVRVALDYDLDERTTIGALVGAYDHKWSMDAFNQVSVTRDDRPEYGIVIDNDEVNHWRHAMGNVYAERKLSSVSSVRADVDYVYYHDNNPTNYYNTRTDAATGTVARERFDSGKITPIRFLVTKTDYETTTLGGIKFQAGAKGAFSHFTNEATFEGLVKDEWIADVGLSSTSRLHEDVFAAYSSANIQVADSVSLQIGLRYEHTFTDLRSADEEELVARRYGNLFPSVSYSNYLTPKQQISVSYTRRITRPSFTDMAPFLYFVDPTTFFTGNADLRAAISSALKADWTFGDLFTSAEYSWEESTIARFQTRVLTEENVQLLYTQNMRETDRFSAIVALPINPTSWWGTQNNLTYVWQEISGSGQSEGITTRRSSISVNTAQNFALPGDVNLEVTAFYQSAAHMGMWRMESLWWLDIGVQKVLPRNYGKMTLTLENAFDSADWEIVSDADPERVYIRSRLKFSHPTLQLTYSLRFGEGQSARRRATASTEEQGRVQ